MTINLTTYRAVEAANFVKIAVPGDTILVSDFRGPLTIAGDTYSDIGSLLGITSTASEIRATEADVTVTISGIPSANINTVLNQPIKGAPVTILRAYFNPQTHALLNIAGNPSTAFRGVVTNFSVNDQWVSETNTSTFTITFNCANEVGILSRKITGRRTNPNDQKKYFPTDASMDRVSTISRSNFNFGAPR